MSRLSDHSLPQQGNPSRTTVMERIVSELKLGKFDHAAAVELMATLGLNDVIPRFQTIGGDKVIIGNKF